MLKKLINTIGKFSINKKNYTVIVLFAIFPIFLISFSFFTKLSNLSFINQKLENLELQKKMVSFKRASKSTFLKKHTNVNSLFLEKEVENLTFNEREIEKIKKVQLNPAFKTNKELTKRYSKLFSKKNHLKFEEKDRRSSIFAEETEEKQLKPIEIDYFDLEKILSIIEDEKISDLKTFEKSPQFIFKKFDLHKKSKNTFLLSTEIIKREFKEGS